MAGDCQRTEVIHTTCTNKHHSTKYDKHTRWAHHVTHTVEPKSKDHLCQVCAHGARATICSFCPVDPTERDTRAGSQSQGGLYILTPYRIFWAFHNFVTRVTSFEIFFCRLIGKRFDQTELWQWRRQQVFQNHICLTLYKISIFIYLNNDEICQSWKHWIDNMRDFQSSVLSRLASFCSKTM